MIIYTKRHTIFLASLSVVLGIGVLLITPRVFADISYTGNPLKPAAYDAACAASGQKNTIHGLWVVNYTLQPTYAQWSAKGNYPVTFGAESKACSSSYRLVEGDLGVVNIDGKGIFNAPNSIYTGKANRGTYTGIYTKTGSIKLGKLSPGCHTYPIAYQAYNAAANTKLGTKGTTYIKVCLTEPPTPTAKLTPKATVNGSSSNVTVTQGTPVTFKNWVTTSNNSNSAGYNFTFRAVDTTGNLPAAADLGPGNFALSPNRDVPDNQGVYSPPTLGVGTYCRETRTSGYATFVTGGGNKSICVTVIPAGSATVTPRVTPMPDTYLEPKSSYNFRGNLKNESSTNPAQVASTSWQVWLERGSNDGDSDGTPGNDRSLSTTLSGPSARTILASDDPQVATYPSSLSPGDESIYNYVCAKLSATPGLATTVNPEHYSCLPIQSRPFFQVTGGDVNAAAVMKSGGSCPSTSSGFIAGWNNGASGANTNIAAFAAQAIAEFTSYAPGNPPIGLTFANTPATSWGGDFDEVYCIDKAGTYSPGDQLIDHDGNWGDVTVEGSIYITPNVQNITGIFTAKGNIYTCATNVGVFVDHADMKTGCNNKLTVNGSLTAKAIYLLRTHGSVGNGEPAEQFNYGPEVWLPAITLPSGGTIDLGDADSVTSLPPVL